MAEKMPSINMDDVLMRARNVIMTFAMWSLFVQSYFVFVFRLVRIFLMNKQIEVFLFYL